MDVGAYLQRIDYHGPWEPTIETLRQVHKAHMFSVPFENLDIPLGRQIVLSLPLLFDKIVHRRRGGFCYELNGLFGWLLQQIGFKVHMLSARVFNGAVPGPDFDHMILSVDVGEKLVADVGFGDSFNEPIPLGLEEEAQYGRSYRLLEQSDDWVLYRQSPQSEWEPQYVFSLKPRQLGQFRTMCHFHQTSQDSSFTGRSVCSLATQDGRDTLSNNRLIVTSGGQRHERTVTSAEDYEGLLQEHFAIDLGDEVEVEVLMYPRASAN